MLALATREHLPVLDGVRGLALILVVWGHLGNCVRPLPPDGTAERGVFLFFCLSGFLITRILLFDRERSVSGWTFWKRRFVRLMPAALICTALVTIAMPSTKHLWPLIWVANVVRTIEWDPMGTSPLGHFWSLSAEEQFYAAWFVPAFFLPRNASRAIAWGVALLAPIGCVATAILWSRLGADPHYVWRAVHLLPTANALPLFAGATLAFHERAIRSSLWLAPAVAVAFLAVASQRDLFAGLTHEAIGGASRVAFETAWLALSHQFFAVGLFALCLYRPLTDRFDLFSSNWLRGVGRLSYGLYVYHIPFLRAFDAHGRDEYAEPQWWRAALAVGLTTLTAYLSYRFVEQPVLAWSRRDRTRLSAELNTEVAPSSTSADAWGVEATGSSSPRAAA
jgi:peptidoglycan/LPS O-acetylase OafA/YrhL